MTKIKQRNPASLTVIKRKWKESEKEKRGDWEIGRIADWKSCGERTTLSLSGGASGL